MNVILRRELTSELQRYYAWFAELKALKRTVDNILRHNIDRVFLVGSDDTWEIYQRIKSVDDTVSELDEEDPNSWKDVPGLTYDDFLKSIEEPDMFEPTENDYRTWLYSTKSDEIFQDYKESCMQQTLDAISLRVIVCELNYLLEDYNDNFSRETTDEIQNGINVQVRNQYEQQYSSLSNMRENMRKARMTYDAMKKLVHCTTKFWTSKQDASFKYKKENYVKVIGLVQQWPTGSTVSQDTIRSEIIKTMVLALGENAFKM